jgi:hypothetical protein
MEEFKAYSNNFSTRYERIDDKFVVHSVPVIFEEHYEKHPSFVPSEKEMSFVEKIEFIALERGFDEEFFLNFKNLYNKSVY